MPTSRRSLSSHSGEKEIGYFEVRRLVLRYSGLPFTQGRVYEWKPQAELATHVGEDFWSGEFRWPVTSSDKEPLYRILGKQWFQAKKDALATGQEKGLPWYFN